MISRLLAFLGRHIDRHLLAAIGALLLVGLITLYSASGESVGRIGAQLANIVVALLFMWVAANIPPHYLQRLALPVYLFGLLLLIAVWRYGESVNGARRWLHVGVTRIQPSELMKVAVPLALAWYFDRYEAVLKLRDFAVAAVMLLVPVALIAKQPDLGTALIITAAGFYVIFLAGLSWKILIGLTAAGAVGVPLLVWPLMHDYQRQRILTLLDPSQDPLGARLSHDPGYDRAGIRRVFRQGLAQRHTGAPGSSCPSAAPTSSLRCSRKSSDCSATWCS